VAQGNVSQLLSEDLLQVTIETNDNAKALEVMRAAGAAISAARPDAVVISSSKNNIPQLVNGLSAAGLDIYRLDHKRKLEDFFLKLTTA
jgi:hypothetical protein